MLLSRRSFSKNLTASAFAGLALSACGSAKGEYFAGYGRLLPDPGGLLDLPKGFSYRILSSFGDPMSDGFTVPGHADGMECFDLGGGRLALIRNHEIAPDAPEAFSGPVAGKTNAAGIGYDRGPDGNLLPGGTTTIILDQTTGAVERQFWSLRGTIRNCAGGRTPWGSWLSCEEDETRAGQGAAKDHGWVFEVPAAATGPVEPVALSGLGRFNHEAAAVDPRTGIVYLTEDQEDGLFYRFLPNTKGRLASGGRLQALGFLGDGSGGDARNWESVRLDHGESEAVRWIDLDGVDNPDGDLRARGRLAGAAIFARGEGIYFGNGEAYFACTSGGRARAGQIFRYRPSLAEGQHGEKDSPATLHHFLESTGKAELNYCDNLTLAPNGHLLLCEDQSKSAGPVDNHIRGITPDGAVYPFARLRTQTELAGVCFSPDKEMLFVNVYDPGKTLAISGPWLEA
jgi:uncharacterized protein